MRDHAQFATFDELFASSDDSLLANPPIWTKKAVMRRIGAGALTIVSAVCPDYERSNGKFTYRGLGEGTPFTATKHLEVLAPVLARLAEEGIQTRYLMTLADTEFDLPLVVEAMTGGDAAEFLRRCQASCQALAAEARRQSINLESCRRFTDVFPNWFSSYERALEHMCDSTRPGSSAACDLTMKSSQRMPLYRAMAGGRAVSREYCSAMVLRQWAQYAAWGECATQAFGEGLVMVNHTTPNLSRVNAPLFRQGRERIPIIQLGISTMPA